MIFDLHKQFFNISLSFLLAFLFCCALSVSANDKENQQEYVINYGDQLIINIVGYEKELTALVTVRPDGMINYDIVGELEASGLTIAQLTANIKERLKRSDIYTDPQVTVQLKEPSQSNIYIIGDVLNPGQKKFLRPISVIEALASANGFKETADLAHSTIIRQKKNVTLINLEFLKSDPTIQESSIINIPNDKFMLNNGDVLFIPSAIKEQQVNIVGHVHKPGMYPIKSSISIIEALALAGGALENTADLRHIKLIADNGIESIDITNMWEGINTASTSDKKVVNPGDSVIVLEKGKISILGSVEKQGQYLIDDKVSIIEALSLSGIKDNADLKNVKIIRTSGVEVLLDISKLWKNPSEYCKETVAPGDIIIVPAKRIIINWNAIYALVMIFSTLYAVFK